jgi:hypothetical protein
VDSAIGVEIEFAAELSISVPKLIHSALPVVLHAIETNDARVEDLSVSFAAIHAIPILGNDLDLTLLHQQILDSSLENWLPWHMIKSQALIRHCGPYSSLVIPAGISSLEEFSLDGCVKLSEVAFQPGGCLVQICDCAFGQSGVKFWKSQTRSRRLMVLLDSCEIAFLTKFSLDDGNPHFMIDESILHAPSSRVLFRCFSANDHVCVGSRVEFIGKSSFAMCEWLASLRFEANSALLRIEESAFLGSHFADITIPKTVKYIGKTCFFDWPELSALRFEADSALEQIDEKAFRYTPLSEIVFVND